MLFIEWDLLLPELKQDSWYLINLFWSIVLLLISLHTRFLAMMKLKLEQNQRNKSESNLLLNMLSKLATLSGLLLIAKTLRVFSKIFLQEVIFLKKLKST